MKRHRIIIAGLAGLTGLMAACSTTGPTLPSADAPLQTGSIGQMTADGGYELSAAEKALNCRRITGRMQVRILQIRDRLDDQSGYAALVVRQLVSPFGAPAASQADRASITARDVAILKAYNAELAAKKCPTFDLETELAPQPITHTPRPQPAAKTGN